MSGFNKVTSFVLGLIVVLVFLFVFGSRVNISDKLLAFKDTKVTPSPSSVQAPTPAVVATTTTPKKKGFFESLFERKTSPTPTPSQKTTKIIIDNAKVESKGAATDTSTTMIDQPQTIPQTGSPTILLPILVSALGSGLYLRKKN